MSQLRDIQQERDRDDALTRAANALEHIACSLMAIEMLHGDNYEQTLHVHQCFQHDGCAACGTRAQQ